MKSRAGSLVGVGAIVVVTGIVSAQGGGKPATGNPTPGVAQPDPPNPANRVTFTGCLHSVSRVPPTTDPNTPHNTRYELTTVERSERKTLRLEGLDSQFSPFVNMKVEISGQVKPPAAGEGV